MNATEHAKLNEVLRNSLHAANAETVRLRTELIATRAENRLLREKQSAYQDSIAKASWWDVIVERAKIAGFDNPFKIFDELNVLMGTDAPTSFGVDKPSGSWYHQSVHNKDSTDEAQGDVSGSGSS